MSRAWEPAQSVQSKRCLSEFFTTSIRNVSVALIASTISISFGDDVYIFTTTSVVNLQFKFATGTQIFRGNAVFERPLIHAIVRRPQFHPSLMQTETTRCIIYLLTVAPTSYVTNSLGWGIGWSWKADRRDAFGELHRLQDGKHVKNVQLTYNIERSCLS